MTLKAVWISSHGRKTGGIEMKKQFLPMKLQFFADQESESQTEETKVETTKTDDAKETTKEEKEKPAKKERLFSRGEVAKIVKEETRKALNEAEKLRNMNEDEKAEYRIKQLEEELDAERRQNSFNAMSKEASKMLSEASISADDEILEFVVKDTAEATKEAVDKFVDLVDRTAEAKTKEALSGKPPKLNMTPGKQLTKAEIMQEKDANKRQELIKQNMHLFR